MKRSTVLVLLALSACVGGKRDGGQTTSEAASTKATVPSDTLVLRVGDVEVWFTDAREARSSEGEPCVERALEIRHGAERRHVPLLYSLEAPTPLDDTTMRAVLYNDCLPVGSYRVDYATASPRRLEMP